MKRATILAVCVSLIAVFSGCANTKSADSSKGSNAKSADVKADTESENKDNDKRIEELENKVSALTHILAESYGVGEDELINNYADLDLDFGEVHDIYDNSAVINAYKTGDTSKLTDEKDVFIYESLKEAVKDIIKDGMTDYDKEKAVYDYMFSHSKYDEGNLSAIDLDETESYAHTPYGFFKCGETICVGNATTFKLFMDALDIDCKIIHCTEEGEHAWNVVKIDGDWYHVDLTFDGGVYEPNYASFNVNDEIKEQDGYDWSGQEDIPECTSLKYCPNVMKAKEVKDVYEIPKVMKEAFDKDENHVVMKMAVPEDSGDYTVCSDIESLLYAIVSDDDESSLTVNEVFASDGYAYFGLTKEKYEYNDDYNDTYESEDGLEIDTDKFSKAMESIDGYSFDEDTYNEYSYLGW